MKDGCSAHTRTISTCPYTHARTRISNVDRLLTVGQAILGMRMSEPKRA